MFAVYLQGHLCSPTMCHGFVAQDLAAWEKLPTVHLFHYLDDVILTSDSLPDLQGAASTGERMTGGTEVETSYPFLPGLLVGCWWQRDL